MGEEARDEDHHADDGYQDLAIHQSPSCLVLLEINRVVREHAVWLRRSEMAWEQEEVRA